jgi:hypothetical protein
MSRADAAQMGDCPRCGVVEIAIGSRDVNTLRGVQPPK